MIDLAHRQRLVTESLYGNEALRGELDDEAAKMLFDWLRECVPPIVQTTAAILDEEDADELMYPRLKAMRHLAKQVNKLAAHGVEMEPQAQSRTLTKIQEYAATMYGTERSRSLDEDDDLAKQLLAQLPDLMQSPEQLIIALRNELEPTIPNTAEPTENIETR